MSSIHNNPNIVLITVEGNIGSGKSVLLNAFKHHMCDNASYIFVDEPIDKWESIADATGTNILQHFYKDPNTFAFSFQMMAYISRLVALRTAVDRANTIVNKMKTKVFIIMERCLHTDRHVFAKMLFLQGNIDTINYQIYLMWFDAFANDYPINKVVYVDTSADICHERIKTRSKAGEDIIPLDYLRECEKYHRELVENKLIGQKCDTMILDGNHDMHKTPTLIDDFVNTINTFIQKEKTE